MSVKSLKCLVKKCLEIEDDIFVIVVCVVDVVVVL